MSTYAAILVPRLKYSAAYLTSPCDMIKLAFLTFSYSHLPTTKPDFFSNMPLRVNGNTIYHFAKDQN